MSQLEQEVLQAGHERVFEVAFRNRLGDVEEVEDVRVAGELLGQLGFRGGQLGVEVGQGSAGAFMQSAHDLVGQDVA